MCTLLMLAKLNDTLLESNWPLYNSTGKTIRVCSHRFTIVLHVHITHNYTGQIFCKFPSLIQLKALICSIINV